MGKIHTTLSIIAAIVLIIMFSTPVFACEFSFNYRSIEAPLGVTGSIGIRVMKDHHDCSMDGMEYDFGWENVQVLNTSPWEEIEYNLFEKWFEIVLSEKGEGYFLISKDCTQEGYDEKRLPINVIEGGDEWNAARQFEYPYETSLALEAVSGSYEIVGNTVFVEDEKVLLPESFTIPPSLLENKEPIVVFFTRDANSHAVLIAGENVFLRFDR